MTGIGHEAMTRLWAASHRGKGPKSYVWSLGPSLVICVDNNMGRSYNPLALDVS